MRLSDRACGLHLTRCRDSEETLGSCINNPAKVVEPALAGDFMAFQRLPPLRFSAACFHMPSERIPRTDRPHNRRWAKELEGLVLSQTNATAVVGSQFQNRRITRSAAKKNSTRATRAARVGHREAGKVLS
jgi:hypothetical protein